MIKYAKIEGYIPMGETYMMSHVYQWREDVDELPIMILVRAYDTETKMWTGLLLNNTKEIIYKDIDIKTDDKMIKDAKVFNSLKELLKGHATENVFEDYKEVL